VFTVRPDDPVFSHTRSVGFTEHGSTVATIYRCGG